MAVTDCDSSLSWNHTVLVGVAASQVTQVANTVDGSAVQLIRHMVRLTISRDGGLESTKFLHQLGLEPEYEIPLSH